MQKIIIQGGKLEEKRSNPQHPAYMDLLLSGEDIRIFDVSKGGEPKEISPDGGKYLIWSIEHTAWWKPNGNGYTQSREEAGIYSYEKAVEIIASANIGDKDVPNEAMIRI